MIKKTVIGVIAVVWMCACSWAQTFTTGGIVGVEYDYKILKGWHLSAEGELRFDHDFTHYNRAKIGIGTDYLFWQKRIKVGVAYNFLNYHDREDQLFDNRHRIKAFVTIAPKFGSWKIAYRAQLQTTFRDERRGSYKFNPKTYLRNRLQVTWTLTHQPLKLYLSEEFWWRLYKPGDNIIDQLRSTAGVVYDINKHHSLDFFLRFDHEVQVKNPDQTLSIGVAYNID